MIFEIGLLKHARVRIHIYIYIYITTFRVVAAIQVPGTGENVNSVPVIFVRRKLREPVLQ